MCIRDSGHRGAGTTLHANSAQAVPLRLCALGALAGLDSRTVALHTATAFEHIIHLEHRDGRRRIEGVYSLHPALRDAYDLRVFLAIEPEAQRERIRIRSGEALLRRFQEKWIPLENAYFARLGVRECCQLVF